MVDTATNVTTANAGVASCAAGGAAGRRRALAAAANCSTTSAPSYVTYTVPVIVPLAGDPTTALNAINTLTPASYASLLAALVASSGCPASSFVYLATTTAAACGSATNNSAACALPENAATGPNVGGIIGGVLGGAAAFVLFVAFVLAARGHCARCGACCPRPAQPLPGAAEGAPVQLPKQSYYA